MRLTEGKVMEIETRHLREMAARFGEMQERERERRRKAARRARAAFAGEAGRGEAE